MTHTQWTIQEVAQATGISSRTLRHYDQTGLLEPTDTIAGGMRTYDQRALLRLQRILLLRDTGMRLTTIADVLDGSTDDAEALREHRTHLVRERTRVDDQLAAVDATIKAIEKGDTIMPNQMFDGFDHTKYDAEVRERWGGEAADRSDSWWSDLGTDGQHDFRKQLDELNAQWDAVISEGVDPASDRAQEVAKRHVGWMTASWQGQQLEADMLKGISQMYVDDERFAANYNRVSPEGPAFVRDALHVYADRNI